MKRFVPFTALLLCIGLFFLLSACGGGEKSEKAYDPEATVQALMDAKVFGDALGAGKGQNNQGDPVNGGGADGDE